MIQGILMDFFLKATFIKNVLLSLGNALFLFNFFFYYALSWLNGDTLWSVRGVAPI